MIGSLIFDLLGKLVGVGSGALERSSKRKEMQLEADTRIAVARAEAEVKRLEKAQSAEIDWDNTVASQMEHSWKDEWFSILLSVPLILAFLGNWGRSAVEEGFKALSTMPDWYIVSVMTALAASFGVRQLVNRFGFGRR